MITNFTDIQREPYIGIVYLDTFRRLVTAHLQRKAFGLNDYQSVIVLDCALNFIHEIPRRGTVNAYAWDFCRFAARCAISQRPEDIALPDSYVIENETAEWIKAWFKQYPEISNLPYGNRRGK